MTITLGVAFSTGICWAEDTLQKELQQSMFNARQAVLDNDFQRFLSSIDPINPKSKVTEEQWTQLVGNELGRKVLLRGTPDLINEAVYFSIKTKDDWAGYYAQTNLSDDNYQTVSVFLFRKGENGWRPAGKSYGLTKAKPNSNAAKTGYPAWSSKEDMLSTIETDENFLMINLISPKPE